MTRNRLWLFNGYRADGSLIGELEGTDANHALDEFSYEYPDECVRVERIRGSGRPWPKVTPSPDTHLFIVRYVHEGKRHKRKVRAFNYVSAMLLFTDKGHVTSVKQLAGP